MKVTVYMNDADKSVVAGEGTADEMGITVQKPVSVVIAGKESEVTMIMVPWQSVAKFEYVVTEEMIRATTAQANAHNAHNVVDEIPNPNRKQRRAGLQQG